MKGLLIGKNFYNKSLNGGTMLDKRNYDILNDICDELDVYVIEENKPENKLFKLFNIIKNKNFYGLNEYDKKNIIRALRKKKYDFCYIASSLIGSLAYNIKKEIQDINIIVFFQNIECLYFEDLYRNNMLYKYIFSSIAKYNENMAVKYADKLVLLNERDSKDLKNIYGKGADFLFKMTVKDQYYKNDILKIKDVLNERKKILFVGSDFFANRQGIQWFVNNVWRDLQNIELTIVGKDTERWKEFIKIKNINIVGTVDDIKPYYEASDAIIAPIFLGSGMKTKTAEALMYGKYIFGTKEAFEGYELNYDNVGALCNTKEEFILAINTKLKKYKYKYNKYSRKYFEENYSQDIFKEHIYRFLNNKIEGVKK